jgi:hypothetical protein
MSMVTGTSELTAHGVISVGWAALVLAEAADVRTALLLGDDLLLGAGRPGPTVQWRTRDGRPGIRTAPGRVSVSAEVSAAAQGDRFGDGDLLARSAVVAAAALADGAAGRDIEIWWRADADGSLRPEALAEIGPQDRADLLAALLLAADENASEVAAVLVGSLPAGELRAAARRAFVAALAHPEPSRATLARRRAGTVVTSGQLLADLTEACRRTSPPEIRNALAEAHHRIGKAVLAAPDARAVSRIRRSTHTGRLYRLDRMVAQFARLAQRRTETPGVLAGVDLTLLRTALHAGGGSGAIRIRDEAVSDGRTTVDLWRTLRDAGVHGELVGGDRYSGLALVRTGAEEGLLDARGRCVQIESGPPGGAPTGRVPEPGEAAAAALETAGQRQPLRWVTPLAPSEAEDAGLRLRFRDHDVFEPDQVPAHVIRVCGLLYRRLRPDVDAETYFEDHDITAALAVLGAGLHPGGVLVVGSVIDAADDSVRYTDADVFQRLAEPEGQVLRHCARIGLGLGPAVPDQPIPLAVRQERD